jgi:hypothetical protein
LWVFDSPSLVASITSLEKNVPPSSPSKPIFSPSQFVRLLHSTSSLLLHALYHVAFSFDFLAMLRISNLAPSSSFDPLRHFRRGMLLFFLLLFLFTFAGQKPFSGITSWLS